MALVKTIPPKEATGKVKEIYSALMKTAGVIPKPFEMMSSSPELATILAQTLSYYIKHPSLGFLLLAHIRLLVAQHLDYHYCVDFNSNLLKTLAGIDEKQLTALKSNPELSPLNEKDKAMLLFVLKAIKSPESTSQKDIDSLHTLGWNDRDILDALNQGADMLRHGLMFKALKM